MGRDGLGAEVADLPSHRPANMSHTFREFGHSQIPLARGKLAPHPRPGPYKGDSQRASRPGLRHKRHSRKWLTYLRLLPSFPRWEYLATRAPRGIKGTRGGNTLQRKSGRGEFRRAASARSSTSEIEMFGQRQAAQQSKAE